MTRDEFKLIAKGLKAIYTDPKFLPDQNAFDVWYELLKELPYEIASASAQRYMATERFAPTPSDIRAGAVNVVVKEEITEDEAWDMVYKAIQNATYHAQEEFDKLPEQVQKVIASPSRLSAMAQDSDFNLGVESSNFKKSFRTIQQRQKYEAQLPQGFTNLLAETSMNLIGGE